MGGRHRTGKPLFFKGLEEIVVGEVMGVGKEERDGDRDNDELTVSDGDDVDEVDERGRDDDEDVGECARAAIVGVSISIELSPISATARMDFRDEVVFTATTVETDGRGRGRGENSNAAIAFALASPLSAFNSSKRTQSFSICLTLAVTYCNVSQSSSSKRLLRGGRVS